ncbi:MAG: 3-oxoacyl-[acyl-carrier-protein] synthase 3 [Chlamydiae bacterium]|nr:3-oxoacyl-[acyl-carrier-protein] synthase 3 [Chlamydiota bacterium]
MNRQAKIIGTGSYLPEKVLSNSDLEKLVDTTDEWIVSRTGMRERRIAAADEFTSDMGVKAAARAIEDAGCGAEDINLILVATLTPDYVFPSTACLIQASLNMVNAAAVDLQAACSGYIYALSIAKAFVETGVYRNVLIVAAEKLSSIVDYEDRSTCVLFGDGASSCVVSAEGKGLLIRDISLGSDGNQTEILKMPGGGCRQPASKETIDQRLHYIKMGGKEVFKHAVRRMESSCKECIERAGLSKEEISWLIPHQANIRIIEAIAKRFAVPRDRVYITVDKYGNTSASSVGIALDELLKQQTPAAGDHLLLTAFGAGLTWGSAVLTHE